MFIVFLPSDTEFMSYIFNCSLDIEFCVTLHVLKILKIHMCKTLQKENVNAIGLG